MNRRTIGLFATVAFSLAAIVATASLAGLLLPETYARESANWRAQGVGQDWYDLVVIVPLLVVCGVGLARGSRIALVVFAGALLFTAYTFAIYAFTIHFNAFFLIYCAAFGGSIFTLVALATRVVREDVRAWYPPRAPLRVLGWFLLVTGGAFSVMWLAEVIPASARGVPPRPSTASASRRTPCTCSISPSSSPPRSRPVSRSSAAAASASSSAPSSSCSLC